MCQALHFKKLHGFIPHPFFLCVVQAQGGGEYVLPGPHVFCNQYIVKNGQVAEQTDVLEGPGNPQLGHFIRRFAHRRKRLRRNVTGIKTAHLALRRVGQDYFPVKGNRAVGGLVDACHTVKGSGLTGSVGSDKGHDFVFIYIQGQSVDSYHAPELHGYIVHVQYVFHVIHYLAPPFLEAAFFPRPFFSLSGMPRMSRNSPSQENSLLPMMPRR